MPSRDKADMQSSFNANTEDNFLNEIDDAIWMQLNAYADGEASPEEALQIESLLASDLHLSREFSFLKLTAESVSEYTEIDPPVTLFGSILEATTRKKTWLQRVQAWWVDQRRVLLPNALRISTATGVLATAGILAVIVWPRTGAQKHDVVGMPGIVRIDRHPVVAPPETSGNRPIASALTAPKRDISSPSHNETPREVVQAVVTPVIEPGLDLAEILPNKSSSAPASRGSSKVDKRANKVTRTKQDALVASAVTNPAPKTAEEMRHMSTESHENVSHDDSASSLGPDVEPHVEMAMDMTPAADNSDDTTQVTTVSYKPGSISQRVNSAPPTLAMRANDAIKREHELEQYGGYTKDAYNNIQRGEVGVSKVVGKF